jgi:lysozyme
MSFNNPQITMVMDDVVKKQIKDHEGYRPDVYVDTVGVPTGGYGHAFLKGSSLPKYIWEQIFDYDFGIAKDAAMDIINQRGWYDIGYIRRNVIINMIFNLGIWNFLKFKATIAAIDVRDFETAANQMLKSKWASQVGVRAVHLAEQMRTGI